MTQTTILKKEYDSFPTNKADRKCIPDSFKIKIVNAAKDHNNVTKFMEDIGLLPTYLQRWKKSLKTTSEFEATGFVHGTRIRFDLPTKANAVRRLVEEKASVSTLAKELGTTTASLRTWKTKYADTYHQYIDAPTGTPYIASKIVVGTSNIKELTEQLRKGAQTIEILLQTRTLLSATDRAYLSTLKAKTDNKLKLVDELNTVSETKAKLEQKLGVA